MRLIVPAYGARTGTPARGQDVLTLVDVSGPAGAEARVRAAEAKRAADREHAGPAG